MPEIHITVSPFFVTHLQFVIESISRKLEDGPVIEMRFDQHVDEELREAWSDGLLQSLKQDMDILVEKLRHLDADHSLELSLQESGAFLRAASASRLCLRQSFLKSLSREDLETGAVDFHDLSPEDQRMYAVYLFLANLQEQLIAEMDPLAGDWEP